LVQLISVQLTCLVDLMHSYSHTQTEEEALFWNSLYKNQHCSTKFVDRNVQPLGSQFLPIIEDDSLDIVLCE
jgi:hypothetical protein